MKSVLSNFAITSERFLQQRGRTFILLKIAATATTSILPKVLRLSPGTRTRKSVTTFPDLTGLTRTTKFARLHPKITRTHWKSKRNGSKLKSWTTWRIRTANAPASVKRLPGPNAPKTKSRDFRNTAPSARLSKTSMNSA